MNMKRKMTWRFVYLSNKGSLNSEKSYKINCNDDKNNNNNTNDDRSKEPTPRVESSEQRAKCDEE